MAALLKGLAGLEWGLDSETGILAQSYEKAVTGSEKTAKNHEGESVGVSFYDPVADHSVEGYYTGATGISEASFGVVLAISNAANFGGVDAGLIICNSATMRLQNEDYQMISATARQWPGITA